MNFTEEQYKAIRKLSNMSSLMSYEEIKATIIYFNANHKTQLENKEIRKQELIESMQECAESLNAMNNKIHKQKQRGVIPPNFYKKANKHKR
ncbi:hypothetical protein [Elizabethkingia miricola]|uniref:hypothetical protein n=1 Tax=Elizabethkingia miricola TaxID=172045 RepID=UPI000B34EF16|nr:hypothetical protein [Elizabethkingia miricola]